MTLAEIVSSLEALLNDQQNEQVYATFRSHFGDAHRSPVACYLVGVALIRMGEFKLAVQYLEHSHLAGNALQANTLLALIDAHQGAGNRSSFLRYATLLHRILPTNMSVFEKLQQARVRNGLDAIPRWIVIGDSHARYFRFMQINRDAFFEEKLFLDVVELAGASAYGLGNINSRSGALAVVEKLKDRISVADGVIINFGEIDCRRAAWKAAHDQGRAIEDCLDESASHLRDFVKVMIRPFNKNIVVVGAKPQIIGDQDHYRNSLEDDRIVFQPLDVRQEKSIFFNQRLSQYVKELDADFFSLDDMLKDEKNSHDLFSNCFWDEYSTDTHGNSSYFAEVYFNLLKRRLLYGRGNHGLSRGRVGRRTGKR